MTIITVAPTGPIATKDDNPHLPTQPEEIADAVVDAYQGGASIAHLHFRDAYDQPTADLGIARRTIKLIADQCPILIQISTGVGMGVQFEDRAALVDLSPTMATLNPCSMSFGPGEFSNPPEKVEQLAAKMRDLGVVPELEIYDTGHLEVALRLRDKGLIPERMQVSLVLGVPGGMAATPENLLLMANRLPENTAWQVIAIGRANLELTAIGLALGANARAGLEDALHLAKDTLSPGSTPLVERTVRLARDLNRNIADVPETVRRLGLPPR